MTGTTVTVQRRKTDMTEKNDARLTLVLRLADVDLILGHRV